MNDHEEKLWLKERQRVLTGTDMPRLLGIYFDGADGAKNVYRDKTSEELIRVKPDIRMRKGKAMEPFIAELFAEATEIPIEKPSGNGLIRHPDFAWQGATLDMQTVPLGEPVELKDINSYPDDEEWGPIGSDVIPMRVMVQNMWQMRVTNSEIGYVAALFTGGEFRWYQLRRDQEIEAMLVAIASDFWVRVEARSGVDDWQHRLIPEVINRTTKVVPFKGIMLPNAGQFVSELESASKAKREAEENYKRLKDQALQMLGDAQRGMLPDGRILTRESDRNAIRVTQPKRRR